MKKRITRLTLISILACLASSLSYAANTDTSGTGGIGNWKDNSTWADGAPPGNYVNVTIGSAMSETITINTNININDVNTLGILHIGYNSNYASTLIIASGASINTTRQINVSRNSTSSTPTTFLMTGGTLNATGSNGQLNIGQPLTGVQGHGIASFSGGSANFDRIMVGNSTDSNSRGRLNIIGSKIQRLEATGSTGVNVSDIGTLHFEADTDGFSTLTTKAFTFSENATLSLDGRTFAGMSDEFILITSSSIAGAGKIYDQAYLDQKLTDAGFKNELYNIDQSWLRWETVGSTSNLVLHITAAAIPEPSTYALIAGLVLLTFTLHRRRRHR